MASHEHETQHEPGRNDELGTASPTGDTAQKDAGDPTGERRHAGGGGPSPKPSQTQQPRPTWGEQTADLDQQRAVGGGGSSSDSDGQQQ